MKKLATLLLVALLLPLVACADSLMSITDLRAQVEASGGRWTQTYTSVRGETISVDVPVEVANITSVPVLRASWYPRIPDQFLSDYDDPSGNKSKYSKWFTNIERYGFITADHNWDFTLGEGEAGSGRRFEYPLEMLSLDNLNWHEAYAYQNDLLADEAFDFMRNVVQECYLRYRGTFYEPTLNYIELLKPPTMDGVPIRKKGAYAFYCFENIRGLPTLRSFGQNCNSSTPFYQFDIISNDSYSFCNQLYYEKETLVEDIPLLSLEKIIDIYEEMIREGYLRNVYSLRFGYAAIYESGKMDDEEYRLIPCWSLVGEYYDSAKKERKDWESAVEPNFLRWTTTSIIVVNAQTGRLIEKNASNKENQKNFDVKTW